MNTNFRTKDAFGYFRMGLVTGIVDKSALVAWADNEIARRAAPAHEIIELALSDNRSYSQIIWLLSDFEGAADYNVSLKLLLAHAGISLEQNVGHAERIIMGLRLLNEEQYFPTDIKSEIADLKNRLNLHKQAQLSFEDLTARLSQFLGRYTDYRELLRQTVYPSYGAE